VGQSQKASQLLGAESAARLVTAGPLLRLFSRLSVPLLPDHNHTSSDCLVLQVGLSSGMQVTVRHYSLGISHIPVNSSLEDSSTESLLAIGPLAPTRQTDTQPCHLSILLLTDSNPAYFLYLS